MQRFVLSLCCMLLMAVAATAQTLSGTVTIDGSENSALATIRIIDQGIGTTSKLDGSYYLEDIRPGQHTVEFSYIGHKTVRQQLIWQQGEAKQLDVAMEESPIMLTTAFVTPNGEDAVQYILSRVWKNAERKRATMPAFESNASTVLSYSDFDLLLLYDLLPRLARITIMGMASVAGLKSVVKMLIAHPELNVSTTCDLHYKKKSFKWDNFAVHRSSANLTPDEKKALCKMTKEDDLYEMLYGDENKLREKKTRKELKGSYEDGGRMVFVIEGLTKDSTRYTMHVVEDSWDVLSLEKKDRMEQLQVICRPAPGGLYLPVSVNHKLKLIDMTAEQVREHIVIDSIGEAKHQVEVTLNPKKKSRSFDDPEKEAQFHSFLLRCREHGLHMVINQGVSINW